MGLAWNLLIALPLAVIGLLLWSCLMMAGSADRRIDECQEEWLREKRRGPRATCELQFATEAPEEGYELFTSSPTFANRQS